MKIVIAGGSGLLGSALVPHLTLGRHDVVVLSRGAMARSVPGTRIVAWQPDGTSGPWAAEIDGADAVVNLAGAGIADRRWTARRKALLHSSRILGTRSLVAAIRNAAKRPATVVQGSAIGFYGASLGAQEVDESCPPGDDFLARLTVDWEAEAHPIAALGCRLIVVRSGVVLTRNGGPVKKLRLPFQLFGGGPIASGQQYISWIHLDDWIEIIIWALLTPAVSGVINATAPAPVTNAEFSLALARALHRPSWLRMPGVALRLLVGEVANIALINGQRAVPAQLRRLGFVFRYPTIDRAMQAAVEPEVAGR